MAAAPHEGEPDPGYRARRRPRLPKSLPSPVRAAERSGWHHHHPALYAIAVLAVVLVVWWFLRGG